VSETRSLCPRCGLPVLQDSETQEWVCAYCGFISARKPRDRPGGKYISGSPDLAKRVELLNQVNQQFGKNKVDELLKDDPALMDAWRLQLVEEVAKQFGRDKVETMLRDEPELKERWEELAESPSSQSLGAQSPRPDRLWYFAPLFLSVLGGLIAYLVVRDRDKGMAETCLVLGFFVFLVWLLILFFA